MKKLLFACCAQCIAGMSLAIVHFEVEPNGTIDTANAFDINYGDQIHGNIVQGDYDYFRLTPTATPFGLYKNRLSPINLYSNAELVLEGQPFGNQVAAWYSFGSGSAITSWIYGLQSSATYDVNYYRDPITPINLGTFQQGNFRFQEMSSQFDFGILDLQIFDSQGRIVPGGWNTNEFPTFFDFSMELGPGTYYAIAGESIRSEVNRFGSPLGVGNVMASDPIGGVAINAAYIQITTPTSSVSLTDVGHRLSTGPDYIVPYTFTVVPEPASLLALGAGLAVLGRKRWRR